MLKGKTAKYLYEVVAKDAPIYDYHCHLSAKEIYEDQVFEDISKLWLAHDHYKWRAMRYSGVDESSITGIKSGEDKFLAWAVTAEKLIGSPLYHWSNMELHNYFGIADTLNRKNAKEIYDRCNAKIKEDQLSPVKMIIQSNVKLICTTDDPIDDLKHHRLLKEKEGLTFQVLPTFRPDKAMDIQKNDYTNYIAKLEESTNRSIKSYTDLLEALKEKIHFFSLNGCLMSDHSLESLSADFGSYEVIEDIFARRILGAQLSREEATIFKMYTLVELAAEYRKFNWVMQLHIGAYRNVNSIKYRELGVDAGYDIMNDFMLVEPVVKLLDEIERKTGLPKTILYSLNDKDNHTLSNIPQCFTEDGIPGKIQFGPAWWLCDHKDGIQRHLTAVANQGLLAYSNGMLTDSRSFLSYARHEYFRRILCNFIGELVDQGEFECDEGVLKEIVSGICYKNIQRYLRLEEKA